jgi:hypothetical protein
MGILFTSVNLPLDKLQASSEMEINRNLQALSASYRVFKGNYDELVHHLDHLNDPTESLFMYSSEQRDNLEYLIDETSRLFHNFLASAKFGGTGKDPIWQIDDKNIMEDLQAVQDSPTHVSILPRVTMSLEKYETALANTQNDWERVD